MIDGMSIRKQIIYDQHSKKMFGYVDLGNGPEVEEAQASEALVFMVTGGTYSSQLCLHAYVANKVYNF